MIDIDDIKGNDNEPLTVALTGPVIEIVTVLTEGLPMEALQKISDALQAELDRRRLARDPQ